MGKKEKKDPKPLPEDIFDVLQVETHQAQTAVLLLDSQEEDVLSSACESIYKFADKCDDNKRVLLELGCVDLLLALTQHEDRVVRKNATAAFGVLSISADVRRYVKKLDNAVPQIIALLSPQEELVVQEFSALFLSQMALEFTSKTVILENGGMEPLVRGLSSNDPDVQKNCVETIALLMMDFKGRAALREFEGLPTVQGLTLSEYAIIQQLAILVLCRAAQEAECRAILRELDTVSKMVNLISHHEWKDLHVSCVQVLANLLEDTETLHQIKDSGGIGKLVNLITDHIPHEEEIKRDKKGPPKSGKRSAKSEVKKKEEEKGEEKEDKVIPTMPDVKICAAEAISRAAKNRENRHLLHDMEVEKMLIALLSNENHDVQAAAAFALGVMAEYLISRDSIRDWEGILALVKMLTLEHDKAKEASTCALANLTNANQFNCVEVEKAGGVEPLIALLGDLYMPAVGNACTVLMNLANQESLRQLINSKNINEALIAPLTCNNIDIQGKGALAVAAFTCDAESRAQFRMCGGLEALVPLLKYDDNTVRRNACWAVAVCAADEPTSTEICRLGGIEVLLEMQSSATKRNTFADAALDKVLNTNLSAKFAFTGFLSSSNIIADEFYDPGKIRANKKFMTLEEYLESEVDDRRAVISVNAIQGQASQASVMEQEVKMVGSKNNVSGKASRTGRESKTKSRAQKEREERQKEELAQQKLTNEETKSLRMMTCPPDSALLKYLEVVRDTIEPLSTSREQVIALAEFVSTKMGGPIERDKVTLFSWELPISQIKHDTKCNVIPIGSIKAGIHIHRALLFKALADRIALGCALVRGDYCRAWNEVLLPVEGDDPLKPEYPASLYIVDLVHEPGHVMLADSPEAVLYKSI